MVLNNTKSYNAPLILSQLQHAYQLHGGRWLGSTRLGWVRQSSSTSTLSPSSSPQSCGSHAQWHAGHHLHDSPSFSPRWNQ